MMIPADRLLVMVAPNGARRQKDDHPALPITPVELAETALAARQAGAAAIHLHVRDRNGGHTLDVARYRDAMAAIRERAGRDLMIQVTSEAVGQYMPEEQMAMVRMLMPEAVSLAVRELLPDDDPLTHEHAREFFSWLATTGILAQFILYSPRDVKRFRSLQRAGVIANGPAFVLLVLGRGASLGELPVMLAALEPGDPDRPVDWMVCGFGPLELPAAAAAIALGGHVRIGFENNLHLADGRLAPDNAALVRQLRPLWETLRRPPLTPCELRRLIPVQPDGT
ncbi:MAG: 3-keto-5-aminohexanoate cleavage protein [Alphaproteobacteria bacterium]|nr:MAG: 3-keto-5-aminohexanoate cleavage protein [Alphaproteobacteria bacterium]